LLTLRGPREARRGPDLNELNPIVDGSVLIRDGLIVEVGPSRRLENLAQARDALVIEAAGRIVMPGMVDSHTHLAFPAAAADDGEAARMVRSSTGQRIESRSRAYLAAMARHGTTTVEVKTGCGPDESAESKLLRVFSSLRSDPLDLVPSFLRRFPHENVPAAASIILTELLPKIHRRKGARFADIACNGDLALLPYYDRYLETARSLGFACKVHADNQHPGEAVALALRHRVTSIDHLEHCTTEDALRLGASKVMTTLLPNSSLFGGSGGAPARALIDSGAAVAIATNFNPHSNPTLNMQTTIALACLQLKMTIQEAISAATINGAHALSLGHRIGSIEPGKLADLVLLNVPDYHDLRFSLGTNVVHLTIKSGRVIYQEADVAPRQDHEVRGYM